MKLEILGPGPKTLNLKPLRWYIEKHLEDIKQNGEFYVAVALSDIEGLHLLKNHIQRTLRQNGKAMAIIGIDLGMPKNILNEITQVFGIGNVFVYHNPKDSAFHPKMYLIKVNEKLGIVIVGSSNLTNSGLLKNFEINLAVELNLQETTEHELFKKFLELFEKLTNEKSTRPLTNALVSALIAISMLRKKTSTVTQALIPMKLSDSFKGEKHGWEIAEFSGKTTFLMSLSYNDVSGVRSDKYVRIPVLARDSNPKFWGWNNLFTSSPSGGNPERFITIKYKGEKDKHRLYFVAGPDEFRLVMPQIYNLGKNFEHSVLKISKERTTYEMELIHKTNKEYSGYLGWCTEKCPRGWATIPKVWGYV